MNPFEIAFDAAWSTLESARTTVTFGGHTISKVLSAGVETTHTDSDEGLYSQIDERPRYKKADEPESWRENDRINGKVITVGSREVRVTGRSESGGIVVLNVIAKDGQR